MKIKILHQIGLFGFTILFLFLIFIFSIYAFGWISEAYLPTIFAYIYDNLEIGLVFAALFLAGIWFLQSLLVTKDPLQTIIQETEMGEVRILVSAIKGLVEQVVLEKAGIKSVHPKFDIQDEQFNIFLRLAVNSNTHIPSLCREVGELVKDQLFKMVGLKVNDVKILVEEIETKKKNASPPVRVR